MFSDNTRHKIKELRKSSNLSSDDFIKFYHLMKDAYKDGFDYGCVPSREESIPLGTLADMTIQELVNLIRPDDGSHSLGAAALAEAILDHHWVKEVKFSIEDCYDD
jgi:hypothetical protein